MFSSSVWLILLLQALRSKFDLLTCGSLRTGVKGMRRGSSPKGLYFLVHQYFFPTHQMYVRPMFLNQAIQRETYSCRFSCLLFQPIVISSAMGVFASAPSGREPDLPIFGDVFCARRCGTDAVNLYIYSVSLENGKWVSCYSYYSLEIILKQAPCSPWDVVQ